MPKSIQGVIDAATNYASLKRAWLLVSEEDRGIELELPFAVDDAAHATIFAQVKSGVLTYLSEKMTAAEAELATYGFTSADVEAFDPARRP